MKTLKFRESLCKRIMSRKKTSTWRLFDDKNLAIGDNLSLCVWETGAEFARARIIRIKETVLGSLTEADWDGHEKYESTEVTCALFSKYYSCEVTLNTPVKIIWFELVPS